jgi:hypothetical protein
MRKRMVMITSDSHAGRMEIDDAPYLDPAYRSAYLKEQISHAAVPLVDIEQAVEEPRRDLRLRPRCSQPIADRVGPAFGGG